MKFGKDFRNHLEESLPEWRDKFLCYKPLKKLIKTFPPDPVDDGAGGAAGVPADGGGNKWLRLEEWFVKALEEELEKLNSFYFDKEEEFIIRVQLLREQLEKIKIKRDNGSSSGSELNDKMLDIRRDLVSVQGEMLLLKSYSSLNFAGLVKILKKFDKRTGGVLAVPFTQRVFQEPFFTSDSLSELINQCEANLDLLLPEEEVVEAIPNSNEHSQTGASETAPAAAEVPGPMDDLYRSAKSALRALTSLRKESSTSSVLSFSRYYNEEEEAGSGAITSENSPSSSATSVHLPVADKDSAPVDQKTDGASAPPCD